MRLKKKKKGFKVSKGQGTVPLYSAFIQKGTNKKRLRLSKGQCTLCLDIVHLFRKKLTFKRNL
jgi:hypothetical protein